MKSENPPLQVKICGVRRPEDARAAVEAGADAVGLNFFPGSKRYVGSPEAAAELAALIRATAHQPAPDGAAAAETPGTTATAGVFVDAAVDEIVSTAAAVGLDIVQLHGEEPPEFVAALRERLPEGARVWKAWRVGAAADLAAAEEYCRACAPDLLLLDAKAPGGAPGGTGKTFDWSLLTGFGKAARRPPPALPAEPTVSAGPARPTVLALAGGLTPKNVAEAVRRVRPDWVDTAGGVESAPGIKDAALMKAFVAAARIR